VGEGNMSELKITVGEVLDENCIEQIYQKLESFGETIELICNETRIVVGSGVMALLNLWRDVEPLNKKIVLSGCSTDLYATMRVLRLETVFQIERKNRKSKASTRLPEELGS
jgi:anti-anti-sigma regulatory factor